MAPRIAYGRTKPKHILAFVFEHRDAPLTYAPVGLTSMEAPPREWIVDDNRITLGRGDAVFEAAKAAMTAWAMFDLGWVEVVATTRPPEIVVGTTVAVVARRFGFSFVNACRIVEVFDEAHRYGFSYGTTTGHIERGEERFLVERSGDVVTFTIRALSRPAHWTTRVGYPIARRTQKRFARDALSAFARRVQRERPW